VSERKTFWTTLHSCGSYNENIDDFLELVERLRKEVPEEYRGNIVIDFDTDGDYDYPSPALSIQWWKDETDEEYETRQAAEKSANDARRRAAAVQKEKLEREVYAVLKAKYGT
jgi:hypothetical protein